MTRTWDDWNPATRCVWQHFGETCPRGGVHLSREQWRRCFLAYFHQHGVPNAATPTPSLDVAAADGGGGPRPARRAAREQSAPVRAGLAERAWAAVRAAARYAWDATLEAVADLIAGGSSRAADSPVHRTGDQADPATYDPGPTYGWGPGHTGRGWRRWL